MLVEKVWKAARAYGRDGYTVVIHGKHEHEETKATFANTRRHAPAVIVRNLEETRLLAEIMESRDPAVRARFHVTFAGKHTPGFDVDRDLQRVAVVNQTTLLMNETREIIQFLRDVYRRDPWAGCCPGERPRVGGSGRNDTLCYATQVNQDALARALDQTLDAAFVIGGKNSSNTYQLYRVCEQSLPGRAFFIQSEASILSRAAVEHYVFPTQWAPSAGKVRAHRNAPPVAGGGPFTQSASWSRAEPPVPDGIIQQVVARINSLWPEHARSGRSTTSWPTSRRSLGRAGPAKPDAPEAAVGPAQTVRSLLSDDRQDGHSASGACSPVGVVALLQARTRIRPAARRSIPRPRDPRVRSGCACSEAEC
jgi:4-hydroxy-3-methylbut-2-enyl diphosphate reductase